MTTHIAVGTDGSAAADQAVTWAAREAVRGGDELLIVHAVELPVPAYSPYGFSVASYQLDVPQMLASANLMVEATVARVQERFVGLTVRSAVERGEAGQVILSLAAGARLLVVASHEHHLVSDIILGSRARYILHHASMNVAVVPSAVSEADMVPTKHITVGVDGSENAYRALEWAVEEALRWNATVSVIHTWEYPYYSQNAPDPVAALDLYAAEQVDGILARLRAARPDLAGVEVTCSIMTGSASRRLIEAAESSQMLVVGSRGHGGFRSLLVGSVSHQVTQHSIVPVVVVR